MRPFFLLCAASIALLASGCSGNGNGSIEASGTIEGTEINVAAEVAGRILAVPVNEGARVNRGDTLAIINDEQYRLHIKQAQANLLFCDSIRLASNPAPICKKASKRVLLKRPSERFFRRPFWLIQ